MALCARPSAVLGPLRQRSSTSMPGPAPSSTTISLRRQSRPLASQRSHTSKRVTTCSCKSSKSVAIIGTGAVGTACASSLIHQDLANTLLLYDLDTEKNLGIAMDLEDEAFVSGVHVRHCDSMTQLRNADIIVITAGAKQRPGEPRTELIGRNTAILESIARSLLPINKPSAIFIVVANPVDVLTAQLQSLLANYVPKAQVIGSGTYLDTQRLRVALSKRLDVCVSSVDAFVVGEHGDSQVFVRSTAVIGGAPLAAFSDELGEEELGALVRDARTKAYEIIARSGATSHGIGECVSMICRSILLDKQMVLPVSTFVPQFGAVMGWPSVIGSEGVERHVPITLSAAEHAGVQASAKKLQEVYSSTSLEPISARMEENRSASPPPRAQSSPPSRMARSR